MILYRQQQVTTIGDGGKFERLFHDGIVCFGSVVWRILRGLGLGSTRQSWILTRSLPKRGPVASESIALVLPGVSCVLRFQRWRIMMMEDAGNPQPQFATGDDDGH